MNLAKVSKKEGPFYGFIAGTTFLFFVFLLSGCVSAQPIQQLKITVRDEAGIAMKDARVSVKFERYSTDAKVKTGMTDADGFVQISGVSPLRPNVSVSKNGFYDSVWNKVNVVLPENADLPLASKTLRVQMRKQLNPRPLIGKRTATEIPQKNEWVGYDFEEGDWVKPHGDGDRADMLVRYNNEFLGYNISDDDLERVRRREEKSGKEWTTEMEKYYYGDWSGRLEIRFPRGKEGIFSVTEANGFIIESKLRMPHFAPETGYAASITWEDVRNSDFMPRNGDGYFLRVRVKERNGQILKAHYAKFHEELDFDPRGKITFTYCFNPEVNDRNLEFDTGKNLLKLEDVSERVRLP